MKKEGKFKKIEAYLNPLYRKGKPFIIPEKDYIWIQKIIVPDNKHEPIMWMGEDVYFDTLKTKTRPTIYACRGCGKRQGVIKFYIIADNLEEPKPYHPACMRKLEVEVWTKLSDIKSQVNEKPIRTPKKVRRQRSK